jgi:hypothetical protein
MAKGIHFKPYGPFLLGKTLGPLEARDLGRFWADRDENAEGLSSAIGVYLLLIGEKKDQRPIYIGRAEHGFKARLKSNHDAFRKARREYPKETLSILLLSRVSTTRAKLIRKRDKDESLKSIRDLEVLLIRECLLRNIELLNTSETVFFTNLVVPGYLHDVDSPKDGASKALHKMIRAKKPKHS